MGIIIDNSAELHRLGDVPAGKPFIRPNGEVGIRAADHWLQFGTVATHQAVPDVIPIGDLDHEEQVQPGISYDLLVKTD